MVWYGRSNRKIRLSVMTEYRVISRCDPSAFALCIHLFTLGLSRCRDLSNCEMHFIRSSERARSLGMSFLFPESCVPFLNDQPSADDGDERSFRKNAVFFIK